MGLTDELLAYLYWPVSMVNELQLIPTMLENHEKYEEKLRAFNLSRDARAQLAIKCEDFLPHCSLLYKSAGSCCEHYFDPKPYFSALGTCFTTLPVTIDYINPLDIIGVTVNVSKEYSKGISYKLFGPKFATNAIEVAFHSQDHSLAAISQNSLSLNGGTVNKLKLQKTKVSICESVKHEQLVEKK